MKLNIPDEPEEWKKYQAEMGSWDIQSTIDGTLDILDYAEVKALGYETVKGVECYVIEVEPDIQGLIDMLMEQLLMEDIPLDGFGMEEDIISSIDDVIEDMSIKVWIAKDTSYFMKMEIQINIQATAEDLGMSDEGSIDMDIDMTMLAYDYNQAVDIQLPPEAEAAEEVSFFNDFEW
jgi:hypothetical protein